MLTKQQHPFADLGKLPIAEDLPCGSSVKYEPSYQGLEAELAKQESLSKEAVDWSRVSSIASSILEKESKDLLVAAYLAHALLVTEGYKGFACGLQIIHDLSTTFWDDAFPPIKRMRARESALNWLSEKSGAHLESHAPSPEDAEFVIASFELLSDIQTLLDQKMEGSSPGMLEINKPLKSYKLSADKHFKPEASTATASEGERASETPAAVAQNSSEVTKTQTEIAQAPASTQSALNSTNSGVAAASEEQKAANVEHPLADIGLKAISGDSPAGIAVKYEPSFEAIEAELAKQESVSTEVLDWGLVKRLSAEVIETQSKDILVAAYLAQALFETEGYKGLAVGLKIIRDMMQTFWEPMFPPIKRMRARTSALQWFSEKAGQRLVNVKPEAKDASFVVFASEYLSDILVVCDAKVEEGAPSFLELSRPLKEHVKAAEAQRSAAKTTEAPAPQVSETPAVNQPQAAAPAPAAAVAPKPKPAPVSDASVEPANVGNENEAKRVMRQIQDAGRKIGDFLLNAKLTDPRPYRLNRISAWMMIEAVPPLTDGASQLPPPPADKRKQVLEQFEAGKFVELLPNLELTLARAPFWLDGHRISAMSLDALGNDYQDAKATVIRELRNFLSRVEGVTEAAFNDGTPFADNLTLQWINEEVMVSSGDTSETSSEEGMPWQDALNEAKPLIKSGKVSEATQLFNEGISKARGELNKLRWKIALAELLKHGGSDSISAPLLKSVVQECQTLNLGVIEPAICAKALRALYEVYLEQAKKNKSDPHLLAKAEDVYIELFKVDPFIAIKLKEK